MTPEQQEQKAKRIMEFRYAIIAELLNPYLSRQERRTLMLQKAGRRYEIPFSDRTRISSECIRTWYAAYRRFGIEGLRPKVRSDKGVCRGFTAEEAAAFLAYLEQKPELTAKAAYRCLKQQGVVHHDISKSSLSRLVLSAGLQRHNRLKLQDTTQQLKFAFKYPLECVQADMMHAFELPDEKGRAKRTILQVILDDATRRVVYGSFSFRETSLVFEYGLRHVLLTHGRIGRIFTDNGSAFVSSETLRILSILGIPLIHSRVGHPSSRGKIERIFRTIRDQFLRPLDKASVRSLADLNARFHTWVESEYHRSPHRGLGGITPLEAWLQNAQHIIHLDPTVDLDEIFKHEVRRRIYGDCTFTLEGVLYEVPGVLKGKNITVRFNPFQAVRTLELIFEKRCYGQGRVVDTYANTRVKRICNNNPDSGISHRDTAGRPPAHPSATPTRAAFSASKLDLRKGATP